jgi:hypothetical protein
LILDFDATEDRVQGQQEGRFFHGYYGDYCFLPLYVFCGEQLRGSYLRPAKIDPARHAGATLKFLVARLRRAWPKVKIIFRGDSGFCRWRMLRWCEGHEVGYLIGRAKNARGLGWAQSFREQAQSNFQSQQQKQRRFGEVKYAADNRQWMNTTKHSHSGHRLRKMRTRPIEGFSTNSRSHSRNRCPSPFLSARANGFLRHMREP